MEPNTQIQRINANGLTGLRAFIACDGHAMPSGQVKPFTGGFGKLYAPIFAVANGLSVPISRGSPPAP